MATHSEEEQIDPLSDLTESLLFVIMSFLPIDMAIRASILSRRFRYIWEATHLIEDCTRHRPKKKHCSLLHRDPSYPLTHLILRAHSKMKEKDFTYLLLRVKEQFRSLRHLKVDLSEQHFESSLPIIFSFDNLLSLSFGDSIFTRNNLVLPSHISLTGLKSLSICWFESDCDILHELLSRLCCLEDLFITLKGMNVFKLTSQSVKKLVLTIPRCGSAFPWLCRFSIPNLESLNFKIQTKFPGSQVSAWMPHFWGKMPRLRRAFISIDSVCSSNVPVVHEILRNITNVEHIKLDLAECHVEMDPFHMMLNPCMKPLIFPNLKSFDLSLCFHKENMEDLIRLLQNSPALESLNLVHKGPNVLCESDRKKGFKSRLPRNSDGNHRHVHYCDLHLEEKREQLIKKLSKKFELIEKRTSKRIKI